MKKDFNVNRTDALIVADVQNDFCPGGALPVPECDQVIPILNDYIKIFEKSNAKIFATRDWQAFGGQAVRALISGRIADAQRGTKGNSNPNQKTFSS